MARQKNRKMATTVPAVRSAWQQAVEDGRLSFLGARVLENIADDNEDLRLCWCCGKTGYQERAHVVPHSLGGDDSPLNLFLLCAGCHAQSPDTKHSDWFFKWISDEAERHADADAAFLKKWLHELRQAVMDAPDPSEFSDRLNSLLGEELRCAKKDTTTHGADVAKATRQAAVMCGIQAAIAKAACLPPAASGQLHLF